MKTIYTSGVFDLLHESHIRALRAAKEQGKNVYFIVGVATDEDTMMYKRRPIIPYEQRLKMIESLDFVDKVITAPLFTCRQFYDLYNIDIHVQGEDDAGTIDYYKGGKEIGIMKFIGRDPIESTTSCIQKLHQIVGSDYTVTPLHGGISNMVWKLKSPNAEQAYVLKYLQSSTVESFSKKHDCIIIGGTFALYEYIDGVVGNVTSNQMIEYFLEKMKHHKTLINGDKVSKDNVFSGLMRYLNKDDEVILDQIELYKKIFDSNCLWHWSHNDLVRDNIIISNGEIKLIDWEYAELAPFEMDIASCIANGVIDLSTVSKHDFNLDLIITLTVFQCLIWIRWYEKNNDKMDKNAYMSYVNTYNQFLDMCINNHAK